MVTFQNFAPNYSEKGSFNFLRIQLHFVCVPMFFLDQGFPKLKPSCPIFLPHLSIV